MIFNLLHIIHLSWVITSVDRSVVAYREVLLLFFLFHWILCNNLPNTLVSFKNLLPLNAFIDTVWYRTIVCHIDVCYHCAMLGGYKKLYANINNVHPLAIIRVLISIDKSCPIFILLIFFPFIYCRLVWMSVWIICLLLDVERIGFHWLHVSRLNVWQYFFIY